MGREFLLLVGRFVFLIHDDEAQVERRREQRAARANHHVHQAIADAPPLVEPLPLGEAMMQYGGAFGEPFVDQAHGLRRQRNLRHQVNRLLAQPDGVGNGPQIHLGFAAAGDAVQQQAAGYRVGVVQRGRDAGQSFLLRRRQRRRRRYGRRGAGGYLRFHPLPFLSNQAALQQRVGRGAEYAGNAGGVIAGVGFAH